MAPQDLFPIIIELLEGLGAAHEAGIIHRDLKPDNIFLLKEQKGIVDFVKILDFGVSKFTEVTLETMDEMTRTGVVMGTPFYMAPEQARGERVDRRADVFAVGVILFKGLSGKVPFPAKNFNELILRLVQEDAPAIETVIESVDPGVSTIIAKALARNADERYQDAEQLAVALEQWLEENGWESPSQQRELRRTKVRRSGTSKAEQAGAEESAPSSGVTDESSGSTDSSGALTPAAMAASAGAAPSNEQGDSSGQGSNKKLVFGIVAALGLGGGVALALNMSKTEPPAVSDGPASTGVNSPISPGATATQNRATSAEPESSATATDSAADQGTASPDATATGSAESTTSTAKTSTAKATGKPRSGNKPPKTPKIPPTAKPKATVTSGQTSGRGFRRELD